MKSILIVDDDEKVRTMLQQSLEREGYKVLAAEDGEEGLKIFRKNEPDLIITDLVMPEKEGLETILELRRDYPDIKIIAISGGGRFNPKYYLDLAEKFGAQYTLYKPFERDELLKAVQDLLG
jgi:CheY-like chemotaxis protein